jgi:hypothetical protein
MVAYIFRRTTGLPLGAHPGVAENVSGVDLMTTIFEAILVAGAALLLIRPDFAATRHDHDGGLSLELVLVSSTLPLLVLVSASVALADPDLIQHSHNNGAASVTTAGHAHGTGTGGGASDAQLAALAKNRCDLALNPAAYWRETTLAGVDTLTGGDTVPATSNVSATIAGSAALDNLIAKQTTSKGELGDAEMVSMLAGVSDAVYDDWLHWLASTGLANHQHGGNALAPDDNGGMGGHLGPQPWHAMTDQAQCDELSRELALARDTALKYPTVKDAKAAGWRQVTPYVPGIAAQFMNFSLVDD